MEQWIAYGLMALVVAALCLINARKGRPAQEACDRFALLFLEARDYAVGPGGAVPLTEANPAGEIRLRPGEAQPEAVRAALARGRGEEMARYDERLEERLRALFQAIGTGSHEKTRYFDYMNSLFTLHKLFLQACTRPDLPLTEGDEKDLELYTGDRGRLVELLSQRMSGRGRRALAGQAEQLQPQRKEGIG